MHYYDVYEALYLNCEIHISLIRVSDPTAGPIWLYCENVLNIGNSYQLPYTLYLKKKQQKNKCLIMMTMKLFT